MNNIVLIGPSGIGKTTVGTYISNKYDLKHIDTDDLIEKTYNTKISEIFRHSGESYFRKLESRIIQDITDDENLVISTGGGVVLDENNIANLRMNGIIFLLFGKIETIINNISKSSKERPLIVTELECYESVRRMYEERKGLYIVYGDYIINVDHKSVWEIGDEIILIYKEHLSCGK